MAHFNVPAYMVLMGFAAGFLVSTAWWGISFYLDKRKAFKLAKNLSIEKVEEAAAKAEARSPMDMRAGLKSMTCTMRIQTCDIIQRTGGLLGKALERDNVTLVSWDEAKYLYEVSCKMDMWLTCLDTPFDYRNLNQAFTDLVFADKDYQDIKDIPLEDLQVIARHPHGSRFLS
jgi:hypothetical protein